MSVRPAADRTVLGIGLAFVAFAVLATADALTKVLFQRGFSVFEIASVDAVFALAVALPFLIYQDGIASLKPRRIWPVLLRSAMGAASLMTAIISFALIPLADAYSIAFVAPLMVTALSAPLLGERVGWRQWVAVVIGFVAVILILRPDFGALGAGQVYMLISASFFAFSMLMLRRIAKTEGSGALLLVYFTMLFLIGLPVAIAHWQTPNLTDFLLMVLTGVCSGGGNLVLILAFRYAAATLVSSFMYSQLLWGTVFGLFLFGDLPDLITLGGAAVIILCGIYTLTHASRAARAVRA